MTQSRYTRMMLALALIAAPLFAQDTPAPGEHHSAPSWDPHIPDCSKQPIGVGRHECFEARSETRNIVLHNATQQNEANEILVAVRNMFDPSNKIYLVPSENVISITTYPEEFERIQAFVKSVDLPKKSFRITYTVTDIDGEQRVGTQHFSLVAVDGQRATLKQGSKIPVATGTSDKSSGNETQFTYLDIGMNIDVTLDAYGGGVRLRTKVEQSSSAPTPTIIAGVSEPVIRQSVIDSILNVPAGKPIILGSVDVAGSTHRLDIAVAVDPLP